MTYPDINPVLLQIGPVSVRWYALSYIAGILLGWLYARRIVTNDALWGPAGSPISKRRIDDFVVFATLGIVIGGRLGYVFIYDFQHFVDQPLSILALWEGGMSFHGALVGTVVAMGLFASYTKIPAWSLVDIVATVTPIGLFLGRIANFINGELYGRVTTVPWGMVFPNGGPEPRHPSQLYESALEGFVLFWVLWFLVYRFKMLRKPAFLSGAFVAGYGAARTFAEFFRQPDVQIGNNGFIAPGITMGMLLSVPMVIIGIAVMVWAARRKETPPTSPKAASPKAQKSTPARSR